MHIGLMPSDTAAPFAQLKAQAQAAEAAGFASLWVADHLIFRVPDQEDNGIWEAFTLLAGLAAVTERIQLGPLVACTSFRNPALLAKIADTLDEVSGGRSILGLGAGWHEPEYTAYGYPFDHLAARFEESLQITLPMLRGETVDFNGQYVQVQAAKLIPHGPSPKGPPIWIGAKRPRMLRLIARYAAAFNMVWHTTPEPVAERIAEMTTVCHAVGRDPATLTMTAGTVAQVLGSGETPKEGERGIFGNQEEIITALQGFAAVGVQHLVVIVPDTNAERIARFAPVIAALQGA